MFTGEAMNQQSGRSSAILRRTGGLMGFLKHIIKSAYHNHQHYHKHDYCLQSNFAGISPIDQIFRKGKKLVYIFIVVAGLVLLFLIVLLIILAPMLLNGIDWVYHNGISGIVKLFQAILDKLWKGAGL